MNTSLNVHWQHTYVLWRYARNGNRKMYHGRNAAATQRPPLARRTIANWLTSEKYAKPQIIE